MPEPIRDQRELVLDPTQYALVQDETKGNVITYVGPTKVSLSATDKPVRFKSRKFEPCKLEDSIQNFPRADEGQYIVLENPEDANIHPLQGASAPAKLQHGRQINIPGPCTFPLFPGQVATVIPGHNLRSNQYVLVRVHNEEVARQNWDKAVVKKAGTEDSQVPKLPEGLTIGKLFIITGAEVSFYIPPTGVEVVPDEAGNYVRDAVTLERLEYAILLNEDGNKRWPKGPAVVFPKPTEVFICTAGGGRKYRAIELNENAGIYVKVIADYEEGGQKHKAGDELFITGKEQSIYFPRPEHALIKYGDQEIHYAIAIPAGEGRYVLNKITGDADLITGPKMFLPDPRKEVIVRRLLDARTVSLWFPGNTEALAVNKQFERDAADAADYAEMSAKKRLGSSAVKGMHASDTFERKTTYTAPRTITLDTKYDGAVKIDVWTGYAVMIVDAKGQRKVITGPKRVFLGYNETLEKLALSTGKPKTTDNLYETVYLRVLHNKVSDLITVETKDLCELNLKLSYRVNFTGNQNKWFNVENYVKLLCDHLRSLLKCAAKKMSIEELYANAPAFVRDTILGVSEKDKGRPGRTFEENGMKVYDVEVLGVSIKDEEIQDLLAQHQKAVVRTNLELAAQVRDRNRIVEEEKITRQIEAEYAETAKVKAALSVEQAVASLKASLEELKKEAAIALENSRIKDSTAAADLERKQREQEAQLKYLQAKLEIDTKQMHEIANAFIKKAAAVSPQLVGALQTFGDKIALQAACKSVAPLAILGGDSVADVVRNMFAGTVLEKAFGSIFNLDTDEEK